MKKLLHVSDYVGMCYRDDVIGGIVIVATPVILFDVQKGYGFSITALLM